jgi:ATP-dependent helicase HrpA
MVAAAWAPYAQWRAARPEGWPTPPDMTKYRFLVEEFRVSLFAQRLGTRLPVSKKRLESAWAETAS